MSNSKIIFLSLLLGASNCYAGNSSSRQVEFDIKAASRSLFKATENNDCEEVQNILQQCPEDKRYRLLAIQGDYGYTALSKAALEQKSQIVETLLEYCPEDKRFSLLIIETYFRYYGALHEAVSHGHHEIIKTLLEYCPEDKRLRLLTEGSDTGLHIAVCRGDDTVVKALLEFCPENSRFNFLAKKNLDGNTALHDAAYRGLNQMVKILLEYCPQSKRYDLLSIENIYNQDALYKALYSLKFEVKERRLNEDSYSDYDIKQAFFEIFSTTFNFCPENKRYELLTIQSARGILHMAADYGRTDILEEIIRVFRSSATQDIGNAEIE